MSATDEQETTINIYPPVISPLAEIYTCVPATMKRLQKLAAGHPDDVTLREKDDCVFATVPASWVRITPKRKSTMSDEQRRANAERLARYREARQT